MVRLAAFASLFLLACACKSAPTTAPGPTEPGPGPTEPGPTEPAIDVAALGDSCAESGTCAAGVTCVSYFGIAGPSGPEFKSCEVTCSGKGAACPAGTECITIADGPGEVCRVTEFDSAR
jgi:hypothetical protein